MAVYIKLSRDSVKIIEMLLWYVTIYWKMLLDVNEARRPVQCEISKRNILYDSKHNVKIRC